MKPFLSICCLLVLLYSCGGHKMINQTHTTHDVFTEPDGTLTLEAPPSFWPPDGITCMLEDSKGRLWLGTTHAGLYRYDGKLFYRYTTAHGLSDTTIHCLAEDNQGNIWIGTAHGLCRYDGTRFLRLPVPDPDNLFAYLLIAGMGPAGACPNPDQLYAVNSLLPDSGGVVWVGTANGLYRYDGHRSIAFLEQGAVGCAKNYGQSFQKLHKDRYGAIWCFAANNSSVYRLDKSHQHHPCITGGCGHDLRHNDDKQQHETELKSCFEMVKRSDGKSELAVQSVYEDRDGILWFGSYNEGLFRYSGHVMEQLKSNEILDSCSISAILQDDEGTLWLGTSTCPNNFLKGKGLFAYDGHSWRNISAADGLGSNTVTTLALDNNGQLWIGSDGGGLARYANNQLTAYTEKDGMTHSYIRILHSDRSGRLWMGTWKMGLMKNQGGQWEVVSGATR